MTSVQGLGGTLISVPALPVARGDRRHGAGTHRVGGLPVRSNRDLTTASSAQTLIGVPAVLVAVEIGVTVPFTLATKTVFPSGVIAMPKPVFGVLIGLPAVFVATEIGVTVPAA